jgi:hypothetical protein
MVEGATVKDKKTKKRNDPHFQGAGRGRQQVVQWLNGKFCLMMAG